MEIVLGVPQRSILGPLLCNVFLADLFLIVNNMDIANYADDNTPYATVNDINSLIVSLEEASKSYLPGLAIILSTVLRINAAFWSVLMQEQQL